MIGLAGRRVPPALAIVPASIVAVLVTIAGLMYVRLGAAGGFDRFGFDIEASWTTVGPELLWPVWGTVLGAATLAYYYRRRDQCRHCHRSSARGET